MFDPVAKASDFISKTFTSDAAEASSAIEPNALAQMVPLGLIFIVFYFLLIRPQKKKMVDTQKMLEAVKIGDNVVLSSGIIGLVVAIKAQEAIVMVEIAKDVLIKVRKDSISEVISDLKKSDTKKAAPSQRQERKKSKK